MTTEDPWAGARTAARDDVKTALARGTRICPACGTEQDTSGRFCDACGADMTARYRKPPRWRTPAIVILGLALFSLAAYPLVDLLREDASETREREQARQAALKAAEIKRITEDSKPVRAKGLPVPAGTEYTAAAAGDVDGDGYGDVLVGAHLGDLASLYFGGTSPASQQQALTNPDSTGANFGYAIASAGDVDGDGLADFLVGAYSASTNAGAVHLYLGSTTRAFTRIDLTNPDGTGAYFGAALAGAR